MVRTTVLKIHIEGKRVEKEGKTGKQPGKEMSQLVTTFHPLDKVGIVKGEI